MSSTTEQLSQNTAVSDRTAAPSKLTMPVILLAVFVLPMGISGTAVALPQIASDLGSSPTLLQWVVNGFNAAFAVFTLVWGVLSDRMGYKRTFIAGAGLMVVASVISAAATNMVTVDVARTLAGVAGAAIFTGSSAILSNAHTNPEARMRNFAIFGATIGLGLALGPSIAGVIVDWTGWRGIFLIYGVLVAVSFVLSKALPDIRHERAPGQKVVDFSLLRNYRFLAMSLVPVAAAIGFVTLMTYLPVALSAIRGMSPAQAGLFMLPMSVPVLLGPLLTGRLIKSVRRATPMTMIYVSLVFMVVGDIGLLLLDPHKPLVLLVLPMILLGFSFGLPIGLVDGEAIGSVPPQNSGTAAGVLNFLRLGSEAVVIGAYSAALTWLISRTIADPETANDVAAGATGHASVYADAFHWVMAAATVLSALTALAIALLHRAELRHDRRVRTEVR
ncbi:MFS transporter [Streptomyces sp. NPDC086777]|uniref:MFS transporter n=1 Tax=Streptomyces sp. NPDC086777 TaxID=3154866 RepID=UPI00344D7F61